jgi:alpha-tubulin suppressor-like RCC1 family protein
LESGDVQCWGENRAGQLGNGSTTSSLIPAAVPNLSSVVSLTAGGRNLNGHTCAVLSNGSAKCWGYNQSGELGNRSSSNSLIPVDVSETMGTSSFTPLQSHLGLKHLISRVTATNSLGSVDSYSSSVLISGAPFASMNPEVSGTRITGSELGVSAGVWVAKPEPSTTYQWYRCNSPVLSPSSTLPTQCFGISGATASTYTQSSLDTGQYITVRTAKTNSNGEMSVWSIGTSLTNQPPTLVSAPSFTFTETTGALTLSVNRGDWLGLPDPTYIYQPFACTIEVVGASDELDQSCTQLGGSRVTNQFSLTGTDKTSLIGKHLLVKVTATNSYGTTQHFTSSAEAYRSQPVATVTPTISGVREVGSELSVSGGDWVAYPLPLSEPTYQWIRCDTPYNLWALSNCISIDGATGQTYLQSASDAGKFITVIVRKENEVGLGAATTLWNVATNAPPSATTAPLIAGSISLGSQISVSAGVWQGFPSPDLEYSWFECENRISETSNSLPAGCQEVSGSVTQVSSASMHVCALVSNGFVECWGMNSNGQIGDGTKLDRPTPTRVYSIQGVASISSTLSHTCAISGTGDVLCWGRGTVGRLGNGTSTDRTTPTQVSNIESAVQVSAGYEHSCAVLSDGQVKCWGEGASGRLGGGNTVDQLSPISVTGINTAVSVSAGGAHTCAVLNDGSVWCWGSNSSGQLGDGTSVSKSSPVRVTGMEGATSVSAGSLHTCALLETGAVWCWGEGMYWQGSSGGCAILSACNDQPSAIPKRIGTLSASSVSAGDGHSCASLKSGEVRCWGRGTAGQLGENSTTSRFASQSFVRDITAAVSVVAGRSESCAILSDGSLTCWGSTLDGIRLVPSPPNLNYPGKRESTLRVSEEFVGKYLIAKVTGRNSTGTSDVYSRSTLIVR